MAKRSTRQLILDQYDYMESDLDKIGFHTRHLKELAQGYSESVLYTANAIEGALILLHDLAEKGRDAFRMPQDHGFKT